jgi:hypothetical protein
MHARCQLSKYLDHSIFASSNQEFAICSVTSGISNVTKAGDRSLDFLCPTVVYQNLRSTQGGQQEFFREKSIKFRGGAGCKRTRVDEVTAKSNGKTGQKLILVTLPICQRPVRYSTTPQKSDNVQHLLINHRRAKLLPISALGCFSEKPRWELFDLYLLIVTRLNAHPWREVKTTKA